MQIHEKIRQARDLAHLTEEQMAERLGEKRSTYQYWEKKTPSIDKIKRVAIALGKPEDYFFVKHDENNESNEHSNSRELAELTESNRILAESNKAQAEANKIQAEANRIQAIANDKASDSHANLVQMLKEKNTPVNFDEVKENQMLLLAYHKTLFHHVARLKAKQEKADLAKVENEMGKSLEKYVLEVFEMDKQFGK